MQHGYLATQSRNKNAVNNSRLYLLGQVYTGSLNGNLYCGYWYEGLNKLVDYKPRIKDSVLEKITAVDIIKRAVKYASKKSHACRYWCHDSVAGCFSQT